MQETVYGLEISNGSIFISLGWSMNVFGVTLEWYDKDIVLRFGPILFGFGWR